jgi:hypothetical protein
MLPIIPHDKALHAIYGAAAWLAVAVAFTAAGLPQPALAGLVAAAVLGVAKEGWDWWRMRSKGESRGVEWADAAATAIGGGAMTLAAWVA